MLLINIFWFRINPIKWKITVKILLYIYISHLISIYVWNVWKGPIDQFACLQWNIYHFYCQALSNSLSIYLSLNHSSFAVNFMLDIRTRSIITGCDKLHRRLLGEVSFGCSGGHFEVSVLKTLHNTSRVKLLSRVKSGGDK